ncbi:MAG: SpoIIE family protein phosphatase [Anaerolineae bacterium]
MIATAAPPHPLQNFLRAHHNHVSAITNSWLEMGAAGVGICTGDGWAGVWPETCRLDMPGIHVPMKAGQMNAELWVFGVSDAVAMTRLEADAVLLSRLMALEYELVDMTQELISSQDQLLALFSLSNAMQNQLSLREVLNTLAHESSKLFNLIYSATFLPSGNGEMFHYPQPVLDDHYMLRVFQTVARSGQRLVFSEGPVIGFPPDTLCGLVEPIVIQGEVKAVLCLLKQGVRFESPELKLLSGVCDQAGTQIKNVLLYQETLAQARLNAEMEVAKQLQIRLLPHHLPEVNGVDVAAASLPALQVGGDFYHFAAQPGEPFMFAVGDVTGKGMPAALLMAMTRTLLKSKTRTLQQSSPVDVLGAVNDEMYEDYTEIGMFSTMFVGLYDYWEKVLYFANGGHSPVIYCPAGSTAFMLEADGPPVGVLPECICENQLMEFHPGDVLVVATDGFNEARNPQGEMFGYERLLALIEASASESAQTIVNNLYQAVAAFSNGNAQDDDQTVVVIKGVR